MKHKTAFKPKPAFKDGESVLDGKKIDKGQNSNVKSVSVWTVHSTKK